MEDVFLLESSFAEQLAGSVVGAVGIGIELMESEHITGIVLQGAEGCKGIALMTVLLLDDDAYFGTQVLGGKVLQIDQSDGGAFGIFDEQPHLFIGIDIACGTCQIVVQDIARIGHIGGADEPQVAIVFYLIEQVEVFWLQRPKGYFRL